MPSSITGGRRSAIEIVHKILSVCESDGVNKTAIMYRSSLSYDQLQRYLGLLSSQDLIERNDRGHYLLTRRGLDTLEQASNVIRTLCDLTVELDPADAAIA